MSPGGTPPGGRGPPPGPDRRGRSLHRGCWSVRVGVSSPCTPTPSTSRPRPSRSPGGAPGALREGARNVHATIRGIFVACGARVFLPEARTLVSVTYAHTAGYTFTRRDTGAPSARRRGVPPRPGLRPRPSVTARHDLPTINVPPRMLFALLVLADFRHPHGPPRVREGARRRRAPQRGAGPSRAGRLRALHARAVALLPEITLPGLGARHAVAFEEAPTTERLVGGNVTAAAPFRGGRVKAAEELFARVASLRAYAPNARPRPWPGPRRRPPAEAPEDPARAGNRLPGADPDAERLCAVCFASQFHTRGGGTATTSTEARTRCTPRRPGPPPAPGCA